MTNTKEITIIQYRSSLYASEVKTREITGTLDYLINNYFGYTLECGRSWMHEKGKSKIPTNDKIKSGKSLVKALNNAENNKARNGYSGIWYELKEAVV